MMASSGLLMARLTGGRLRETETRYHTVGPRFPRLSPWASGSRSSITDDSRQRHGFARAGQRVAFRLGRGGFRVIRRCILILGMHRSGTSALTKALGLLGGQLPAETMPPAADNPRGYWESPALARFNNQLLRSAGTSWNDDAAVPAAWFADSARAADRDIASRLLSEAFPGDDTFVCKDPRICRLLPFWRAVLEAAGIEPDPVLMLRDPGEVARSLAARAGGSGLSAGASVVSHARGLLLWLRYVLDAERDSRDLLRHVITYHGLLDDWRAGP